MPWQRYPLWATALGVMQWGRGATAPRRCVYTLRCVLTQQLRALGQVKIESRGCGHVPRSRGHLRVWALGGAQWGRSAAALRCWKLARLHCV